MEKSQGTPITRGGGYFIRIGWRAVGYSVDRAKQTQYRALRVLLFIFAVVTAWFVVPFASELYFTTIAPMASSFVPLLFDYPALVALLIYLLTLFFGGLVYLIIVAAVGKAMVRKLSAVDNGFGPVERLRRAAMTRRRSLFLLVAVLAAAALLLEPLSSEQLFLMILLGFKFTEGLFFRYLSPGKNL
ncbi:MAG: hypothetical protein JKY60_01710 [Kordiimonadaceae bacterium]|nr:hypothetical protein [Kordiimonadaceae bacterium]